MNTATEKELKMIAGEHRLVSLEEYAEQKKWPGNQLYWISHIYDEKLPLHLEIGLRANRLLLAQTTCYFLAPHKPGARYNLIRQHGMQRPGDRLIRYITYIGRRQIC